MPLSIPSALTTNNHVILTKSDGPRHWLRFDRQHVNPADLIAAVAASHEVQDVAIEEPDIEDIVRRIYEEGMGEDA